ncbi:TlpA family protein disulfide reductase [Nocardioides sp. GCM10027113]|uniref:TlpA family protein disulfide reductase n=1 Tax=unclassified Nocardioides TaxID=2615069 RepID=UPI00361AEF98
MRRLLVALAAVAAVAAGCADPGAGLVPAPGEARIDVDTPELRQLKRQAGVEPCRRGDGEPVEGGLPEVTLPCFGGGRDVDLSTLRGPMVVNLWASWCGPCRREMPILQDFHERHGDRVAVLGIDHNDPQTTRAMQLVLDTGVTYPLLADPQTELSAAAPFPVLRGLPFWAFVDEQGRVVHQEFLEVESRDELEALVEEHLEVTL